MQVPDDVVTVDWDKGLPLDMLSAIAQGKDILKAMRGVSTTWKQGYESSIRHITVSRSGPLLPPKAALAQRFPGQVSLDIGDSLIIEARLEDLSGFQNLNNLSLEPEYLGPRERQLNAFTLPLGLRLTEAGLRGLRGLPLTKLNLRYCENLNNSSLENLREMPLVSLILGSLDSNITDAGLEFLVGLPLTELTLYFLDLGTSEGLRHLQNMPLTHLEIIRCNVLDDANLGHLRGLPLTNLVLKCGGPQVTEAAFDTFSEMPLNTLDLSASLIADSNMDLLGGLPLTDLAIIYNSNVTDAGFLHLRGLKLTSLCLWALTEITDAALENLRGMPLTQLFLDDCVKLTDAGLSHLYGLPLKRLDVRRCPNFTAGGKHDLWLSIQVN